VGKKRNMGGKGERVVPVKLERDKWRGEVPDALPQISFRSTERNLPRKAKKRKGPATQDGKKFTTLEKGRGTIEEKACIQPQT